jgi:hypothetical protein
VGVQNILAEKILRGLKPCFTGFVQGFFAYHDALLLCAPVLALQKL